MGVLAHHVHSENIAIITSLTVPWGRNGDQGGSSSLVGWGHAVSCNEVHPSLVLFRWQKNHSCRDIVRTVIIRPADSLFRSTFPRRISLPPRQWPLPQLWKAEWIRPLWLPRWRLSIAWHCVCQGPSRALSLVKGWRWLSLRADQA